MRYFNRTNRFAKILFSASAISFVLMLIMMFRPDVLEVVQFGSGKFSTETLFFMLFLVVFLLSLIMAIALKCIAKDAAEELDILNNIGKAK